MPPQPKTSQDKTNLIIKLREKVCSYLTDEYWTSDDYLYKWIEDRNYNVDRAEKALRKCMKWRLENRIDGILNENYESLQKNIIYWMDGRDKEGRIVVSLPCNLCNVRDGLEDGNKETLIRCLRQMIERAANQVRETCLQYPGSPSSYRIIIDANGVDMSSASPDVINFCVSTAICLEDNYPGQMETVHIINASKSLKKLYTFSKVALRKSSTERVKVFSDKKHKWKPEILNVIDPDQIRPRFGGTKPDEYSDIPSKIEDLPLDQLQIKD